MGVAGAVRACGGGNGAAGGGTPGEPLSLIFQRNQILSPGPPVLISVSMARTAILSRSPEQAVNFFCSVGVGVATGGAGEIGQKPLPGLGFWLPQDSPALGEPRYGSPGIAPKGSASPRRVGVPGGSLRA